MVSQYHQFQTGNQLIIQRHSKSFKLLSKIFFLSDLKVKILQFQKQIMGNECCRCDCEQDKHLPLEYEVSVITQSEVGDDYYWRGYQPGYEKAGQHLSQEYVKRACYLIDAFDKIQEQHQAQKFDIFNQILETGMLTTKGSQKKCSFQASRINKYESDQSLNRNNFNSNENLKKTNFDESKVSSSKRLSDCRYCPPQDSNKKQMHSSSHSHLSSSNKYSNLSDYSNSVIKYGI
ncbi:hypothetical protein TTHERM_00412000 (macronuclear) [Tetrahymena thermophila SB210]|uniref:Uncharacterized protein n=1 Tax=Tetrahymena thermophila (strain SB210) TaxID=312017 RepID=I7M2K8_TETTS|nr:hypothetical protein TTHERM_00412000 [Tetrahymena thermophila SB210]EAS00649.2 hypothetical protein TTHERM_00412000 [Tetrahymena thermophila SB210]|eukprot:XP_001020894.2 hypothetical protein TTHERM_00412000 [Tetrahymena thermophila SB210]